MSESIDYIDRYFEGTLSETEKKIFEERCESDPSFAEEVVFYVSTRATATEEADAKKKKEFDEQYRLYGQKLRAPLARLHFLRIAAAASVLLVLGWFFLFSNTTPPRLAEQYIREELQQLSPAMSNQTDSLETGKNAFNRKKYTEAERIFAALVEDKTVRPAATEYLGIVYLVTNRYQQAIAQFDILAADTGLRVNPGYLLKAVTLMKRDQGTDRANASLLLQKIIRENRTGSKEAAAWLKNF